MKGSCQKEKNALAARFDVKDLGKLHYFVGVKVVQDQENVRIRIGQPVYTECFAEIWYGECKACRYTSGYWNKARGVY